MTDLEFAGELVDRLNGLLATPGGRDAVSAVFGCRVQLGPRTGVRHHPTIQAFALSETHSLVGPLSILNGICGAHPDGYGLVAAIVDDDTGNLDRFEVTEPRRA